MSKEVLLVVESVSNEKGVPANVIFEALELALADLSDEPRSTWELYGPDARDPGSFTYNCLMARRLAERGVRYTQI